MREIKDAQSRPATRYVDAQGNLYFVRAGLGEVYKGFRRYANPAKGQRRESGIRALKYVKSFDQAQLDLDIYAQKNHLRQLEDDAVEKKAPVADDYTQYLEPIFSSGYSCNGCGASLVKGDLSCVCPDCGAIYCAECVKDGTFETHSCENG